MLFMKPSQRQKALLQVEISLHALEATLRSALKLMAELGSSFGFKAHAPQPESFNFLASACSSIKQRRSG